MASKLLNALLVALIVCMPISSLADGGSWNYHTSRSQLGGNAQYVCLYKNGAASTDTIGFDNADSFIVTNAQSYDPSTRCFKIADFYLVDDSGNGNPISGFPSSVKGYVGFNVSMWRAGGNQTVGVAVSNNVNGPAVVKGGPSDIYMDGGTKGSISPMAASNFVKLFNGAASVAQYMSYEYGSRTTPTNIAAAVVITNIQSSWGNSNVYVVDYLLHQMLPNGQISFTEYETQYTTASSWNKRKLLYNIGDRIAWFACPGGYCIRRTLTAWACYC